MDVMIVATKSCSHCKNMSKELEDIGVKHCIVYAEDESLLCQTHMIRHSPNLIVDGEVLFRRQPTEDELREIFRI